MRKLGAIIAAVLLAAACGSSGQSAAPGQSGAPTTAAPSAAASGAAPVSATGNVTITYLTHWPPQQVDLMNKSARG